MYLEQTNKVNLIADLAARYPSLQHSENRINLFTNVTEEYESLKHGVGIKLTPAPVFIKMKNKDTVDFLHRISTNSINDLKPFQHRKTLFLNEKGRFIARANLIMLDGEVWLLSDEDSQVRLFSWINKFIIMEDISTEDCTSHYSLLDFFGEQKESFFSLMIGDEINKINENEFRRFDVDGFTFYLFFVIENGNKIFKLIVETTKLISFLDYLFTIKSAFDLILVGETAFNRFRIEKLIPAFPNEINNETNPHEVNLICDVNFKKGCYIGQEIIARLDTYDKVQRKLARFTLLENCVNHDKTIFDSLGETAGVLTSIHHSENGNASALGFIRKKYSHDQNGFYVMNGDKKLGVKLI